MQISEKQKRSLKESYDKINIWEGAVRSGKTYISLWRFLEELKDGPEGEYALICRTFATFKRNVLPMLEKMIGIKAVGWQGGHQILNIFNKRVHIIGADDERAEAKIRGPTFAGAYVDEITIIPESVFTMLISRCAIGEARIFGTTNPDSPYHWVKTNFLNGENKYVTSWQFTLEDNPLLSNADKEYLKSQYHGLWYERFIEGKWVQAEGAVYDHFSKERHVILSAPSINAEYIIGVDYGTTNPCAFVLVGIDRNKFPHYWVEEEFYYDSAKHQRQMTDSEYAEALFRMTQGRRIAGIYLDPSAASFRVELGRIGMYNIFEAKNDVLDGIRFVSDLLHSGDLKICASCTNTINEMVSYVWDKNSLLRGEDKPKKENDHALDALRYAVFSHLFGNTEGGMSAHDRERMYQDAMGITPELPAAFQQPHYRGF